MNKIVDIRDLSPALAEEVARLPAGEALLVTQHGRVVARLSRVDAPPPPKRRTPGRLAGRIHMAPDFDETPDAVTEAMDADIEPAAKH